MQLKKAAADHATSATNATTSDDSWRKDVHLDLQSCLHVLYLYVCSNPAVGISNIKNNNMSMQFLVRIKFEDDYIYLI